MPKKYKKPPILEAVCEFRFAASSKWDLAIPGLIYEQVKADFPQREQTQEVKVEARGAPPQISLMGRVAFKRQDGKQFIQVAPRMLSINQLAPYEDWESLIPTITRAFSAYRDVAKPDGLARIGVRYINAFDIPEEIVEIANFFEFSPRIPGALEGSFDAFICGIRFERSNGRDALKVELTSAPSPKKDSSRILLDLDYAVDRPDAVKLDEALGWVREAHDAVENAFEACMKDKVRALLEPI
jgi:uncharacterized protein (TIGR04255 family)